MKPLLVYVVVSNSPLAYGYCAKFCGSYLACPPQAEHRLVVMCNGGELSLETELLFKCLPVPVIFYGRENDDGYDITAYQCAAEKFDCDLMCCCGESIYFHRAGWLKRYLEAWSSFGAGMYGTFSSHLVRPHLNTTGFCIAPKFLLGWPRPKNKKDRYEFEHGQNSLWKRVQRLGFPVKLVTWDGIYDATQWRMPQDILWRGSQRNLLMWCKHTDNFFSADEATRKRWAKGADSAPRL